MIPRAVTTAIVVHGSWTPPSMDIDRHAIRTWHLNRGFADIGYHAIIKRSGEIQKGRDIELMGAHAHGLNESSIGLCLVGGKPEDAKDEHTWEFNYTYPQLVSLGGLIGTCMWDYPSIIDVMGHRDVEGTTKNCPGFNVREMFGPGAKHIR